MMYGRRTQYESDEDRKNERALADFLESLWSCRFDKLPKSYILDFAAVRGGEVVSWHEIKCRKTVPQTRFPTYIVALKKIVAAREYAEATGLPSFLTVEWSDSVGTVEISGSTIFSVAMGGRRDRGDSADIEPLTHIPINAFRIIR